MKFLSDIYLNNNRIIRSACSIKVVSATYEIDPVNDEVVLCDATTNAFSITLPTAVGVIGTGYTIKKIDSTSHPITVLTSFSETIDGNTSQIIRNKNALKIVSDGANWFVV